MAGVASELYELRGLDLTFPATQELYVPETTGVAVRASGVSRGYGDRKVLRDLNLSVRAGEFVAIVGRSGCGKSTLLRVLAGLDVIDAGTIDYDEHRVRDLPATCRMMFQEDRLLPWLKVIDNVVIGLRGSRIDMRKIAGAALEEVGLSDRADDWPRQLSGGQKQRVALARALASRPRMLLLDEPLGALDALTRIEMQGLIERLWLEHGFTALLVTHDVNEAAKLADRIVILEEGRICQDENVQLSRPRVRGTAELAAVENRVLQRLLVDEAVAVV